MQIFELIPKVMRDIGAVAKSQKNESQKYMFRGIDAFYQAAHPAMVAHGVFCAPEVLERSEYRFEKTNYDGKSSAWIHVAMKICHRFYAPDGSYVEVVTIGEGLDNSDKASNKCMSAAMKYALIELFCVPTRDIEDSDKTTPELETAPIVLTPTVPTKKKLEAPVEVPEFLEEFIDIHQKSLLSKRFRESVRPELETEANTLRHSALLALEQSKLFRSKFVDKDGNPTQDLILKSEYASIGRELVKGGKESVITLENMIQQGDILFNPDDHTYLHVPTKKKLTPVSRVIDVVYSTKSWDGVNPEIVDNARLRGIAVDRYMSSYIRDGIIRIDPSESRDVTDRVVAAHRIWEEEFSGMPAIPQSIVYSLQDGIAGTLDFWVDGSIVVDLKCTARIERSWILQLGGYIDMAPYPVKRAGIIHVPKEGACFLEYNVMSCRAYWRDAVSWWEKTKEMKR